KAAEDTASANSQNGRPQPGRPLLFIARCPLTIESRGTRLGSCSYNRNLSDLASLLLGRHRRRHESHARIRQLPPGRHVEHLARRLDQLIDRLALLRQQRLQRRLLAQLRLQNLPCPPRQRNRRRRNCFTVHLSSPLTFDS